MTRKNLSEIINNRHVPDEGQLLQLEKIAEQYPYCQTFWALLAAGWAVHDPLKFQQNLPKMATILPNRSQLKNIVFLAVNQQPLFQPPSSFSEPSKPLHPAEKQETKDTPPPDDYLQNLINQLEEIEERISDFMDETPEHFDPKPQKVTFASSYDITKIYETNDPKDAKKSEKEQLIDRFLEKQPTIPRTTGDFFSPENVVERSIDEDQLPVSETLAILLAKQGQHQKAIEIYQKLILENPKKNAYFAAQIKKLLND